MAENLNQLAEAIGCNLAFLNTELSAAKFNLDILAKDAGKLSRINSRKVGRRRVLK